MLVDYIQANICVINVRWACGSKLYIDVTDYNRTAEIFQFFWQIKSKGISDNIMSYH